MESREKWGGGKGSEFKGPALYCNIPLFFFLLLKIFKSLTTERWRPRRWPCPSSLPPSGWRHHVLRWKQSWARAWSTPAWLSGRTSISSAECAAPRGHPVEDRFISTLGGVGRGSAGRWETFPQGMGETCQPHFYCFRLIFSLSYHNCADKVRELVKKNSWYTPLSRLHLLPFAQHNLDFHLPWVSPLRLHTGCPSLLVKVATQGWKKVFPMSLFGQYSYLQLIFY